MLNTQRTTAVLVAVLLILANPTADGGMRGGGGGMRGGGGGGGMRSGGGGAAARPAPRPAPRPSVPNLGGGGVSRPASRPNVSRPAVSKPAPSRPQFDLPSGGMKPTTRPASRPIKKPTPGSEISRPGAGNLSKPNLPNFPDTINRPSTRPVARPGVPDLGNGVTALPGKLPGRLPSRPIGGGRPGENGLGGSIANRPTGRPSAGDLGDFLGMNRPVGPETLPGNLRPGAVDRPGIAARPVPGNRPGADNLPGLMGRPGLGDRPTNISDMRVGNNTIINNRPSWTSIDRSNVVNINNRWYNQIGGIQNWGNRYPNRLNYWNHRGTNVRVHIGNRYGSCFGNNWWHGHPHAWCGWHYGYRFPNYGWGYWWRVPTYAAVTSWFTWVAPPAVWSQPIYYDYGQGGNVTYNNNNVYIDGQEVATVTEFAQTAATLATVDPPASEEIAAQSEWMPLGTFAVSAGEKDEDPARVIQLAVNKEGIVSGTLYNSATDQSQTVQGQVDKDTQRVAFRIGESEDIVIETGLYNLTQSEANALVHFGPDKVEQWLLVRLENPEAETAQVP